ncbi:unnamed protein product [Discula destructiva]
MTSPSTITTTTIAHPTFPHTALPLCSLALATTAAFIATIQSEWADLAPLWTNCSLNGGTGGITTTTTATTTSLPAPLCLAIRFFQAAHASTRGQLEQAAIVSFLAALATVTATEAETAARTRAMRGGEQHHHEGTKRGYSSSSSSSSSLAAAAVIGNLAVPWLLYSCALGALAWQCIIIPAFLHETASRRRHRRRERHEPQAATGRDKDEDDAAAAGVHSLAIPLSIAFGLLLPAVLMLLFPRNPVLIIIFLLFPIWIALARRLLITLLPPASQPNPTATFALPIILSALSHTALCIYFLTSPSSSADQNPPPPPPPPSHSALHLLELDHAAIFLAALHWLYRKTDDDQPNTLALARTLAVSLVLGPGAGVCVGWMAR